ncbi:hypothetical protein IV102_10650 [bacterium]|nr:hypothetical protein [bacterium]
MRIKRSSWFLGLVLGSGLAGAAPAGFVVRVEGPRIVINRGSMDQVKVGDRFVVLRQGRNIAELVIQNVNNQESQAVVSQLFSQESVLAGDALSISGDTTTPVVGLHPKPPRPLTPNQLTMEQSRQDYEELLRSRTQSQEFSQKWSGKNDNPSDFNDLTLSTTLDSLGYSIWAGGWWGPTDLLLRTANQALLNQHMRDSMMKDYVARLEIEVTRWDSELLDAYCKMQAAQQGMTSVEELNALRSQLTKDKALDSNDVFQVRIKNIGELNVEMSPFHWHMFVSGPDDKRVTSSRYDQVLDRKLNPKQEVVGFITFPKVPNREDLKVYLEDVYGDHGEFSFSR